MGKVANAGGSARNAFDEWHLCLWHIRVEIHRQPPSSCEARCVEDVTPILKLGRSVNRSSVPGPYLQHPPIPSQIIYTLVKSVSDVFVVHSRI